MNSRTTASQGPESSRDIRTFLRWVEGGVHRAAELADGRPAFEIGREADVEIADPRVHGRHARVEQVSSGEHVSWQISCLDGATNGMFLHREGVNLEKLDQIELEHGFCVVLGGTGLTFSIEFPDGGERVATEKYVPPVLTPRELEMVDHLCRGGAWSITNQQIGDEMNVSAKTIEKHLASVYMKFGLNIEGLGASKRSLLVDQARALGFGRLRPY